jgi:hypothetical protein
VLIVAAISKVRSKKLDYVLARVCLSCVRHLVAVERIADSTFPQAKESRFLAACIAAARRHLSIAPIL